MEVPGAESAVAVVMAIVGAENVICGGVLLATSCPKATCPRTKAQSRTFKTILVFIVQPPNGRLAGKRTGVPLAGMDKRFSSPCREPESPGGCTAAAGWTACAGPSHARSRAVPAWHRPAVQV